MPRTGGVFSLLSGSKGVPNTTIQSAPYNAQLDDFVQDANQPRPITAGGTGATNVTQMRTNFGLVPGTDIQAYSAALKSIADLTTSANQLIYTTGADTYATTALTAFARTILDDADAAAVRLTLGLGTLATLNSALGIADGGTGATTESGARDNLSLYSKAQIDAFLADPWAYQPIGVPLPIDWGTGVFTPPPKDKAYRYILLSAGATGAGLYNAGVLGSENVSGSWPTVNATGVVNLAGSPFNGVTIRLINTERRFIRAGDPGALQDSAFSSHNHSGGTTADGYHDHELTAEIWSNQPSSGGSNFVQPSGSGYYNNNIGGRKVYGGGLHAHAFTTSFSGAEETRARNIGANFYMRIK